MSNELPWFRCFPDRLLGALGEMDADTQHVYVTVLLKIYARGGPIKDDPRAIATFCRRSMKTVRAAIERLAEMGRLTLADGTISNHVAEVELQHRDSVSEVRARIGKQGGLKSGVSRSKKAETNQGSGEANGSARRTHKTREEEIREEEAASAASAGAREASADRKHFDQVERTCRDALGDLAPADLVFGPALQFFDTHGPPVAVPALIDAARSARQPVRTWRLLATIAGERLAAPAIQPVNGGQNHAPNRRPSVSDLARADIARLEREAAEQPMLRIASG